MASRKFFVGGNWKCDVTNADVEKIVTVLNEAKVPSEDVVEVVVSPPSVFLQQVKGQLRPNFAVAAQNCWLPRGSTLTGEISAEMLVNLKVPWVILGHCERRDLLGESNDFVADKVAYALTKGLKVIACIGETRMQSDQGKTMEVVASQIKAIAEKITDWTNIVLAYAPFWAILGYKVPPIPAQVQEVHDFLRKWLHSNVSPAVAESTRIIYGGSVNGASCKELAALPDVDGFLLGRASLQPEFVDIIKNATVDGGEFLGFQYHHMSKNDFTKEKLRYYSVVRDVTENEICCVLQNHHCFDQFDEKKPEELGVHVTHGSDDLGKAIDGFQPCGRDYDAAVGPYRIRGEFYEKATRYGVLHRLSVSLLPSEGDQQLHLIHTKCLSMNGCNCISLDDNISTFVDGIGEAINGLSKSGKD